MKYYTKPKIEILNYKLDLFSICGASAPVVTPPVSPSDTQAPTDNGNG